MATIEGYQYADQGKPIDLGTITVGTSTDVVKCIGAEEVAFAFTVASIGTNTVIKLETSVDGTNFTHWDVDGIDYTITANGTYILVAQYCKSIPYVKGTWVSTSGGTPTITVVARVSPSRRGLR